jgi:hypothetical protein
MQLEDSMQTYFNLADATDAVEGAVDEFDDWEGKGEPLMK